MISLIRLRRHRVPITAAIFLLIVLYQFSTLRTTTDSVFNAPPPPPPPPDVVEHNVPLPPAPKMPDPTNFETGPVNQPAHQGTVPDPLKSPSTKPDAGDAKPDVPVIETKPAEKPATTTTTETAAKQTTPPATIPERPAMRPGGSPALEDDTPQERYPFPKPYYPVPSPVLQIPQAAAAAIPQIQADFPVEAEDAKMVRLARQKQVKDAFLVSWNAYRTHAIPHDELSPVTRKYKDPFGGWGATLVDALDTLWIMDLKDEFKEAVSYVGKIDFTTTPMRRMRVFETVIRYLGGLIAAYDLSGQDKEYKVLLDKSIELADVLMGTFDTPNRMPLLAWGWMERDRARHPRAEVRAVAAELGTLSLEFTRLAQITGNATYYDAVARITDALEEFQDKTSFPGLWPLYIDASGCKRVKTRPITTTNAAGTNAVEKELKVAATIGGTGKEVAPVVEKKPQVPVDATEVELHVPPQVGGTGEEIFKRDDTVEKKLNSLPSNSGAQSTDLDDDLPSGSIENKPSGSTEKDKPANAHSPKNDPKCEPQGLAAPHLIREEKYSLGAMIDSLYEYLLKQYLLLGGHDQYKTMYTKAMDVAGTELTYRPRVPGNPDILLAGAVVVKTRNNKHSFEPDSSHLACFAGGMFAMGAKTFGRDKDLDIGSKLTDGCVWAYASMRSGIMPETFNVMPCKDKATCAYDHEAWVTELEPPEEFVENRNQMADMAAHKHVSPEAAAVAAGGELKKMDAPVEPVRHIEHPPKSAEDDEPAPVHRPGKRTPPEYKEMPLKTSREFAEDLIAAEDLPEGFLEIGDRRYILRPEAIESVWYMYRITADTKWADKGWGMWEKVIRAVSVEGKGPASAIADVTLDTESPDWDWLNSLESFWFGETLKYYYLLFSTPDTVSLDEYVLNTEAHPFRRADWGKRTKKPA
ncbi:glycosyl hydrolase family 47-domain-containing protein [Sphaerosporella brunnea]|uniref:alpha-1,2-Mannosidase n=1 Tax=Sphaerosporella brunnea TaxID=1250544 RepID=A0A5J5EYG6_9PEZI|nr:glycosyl hydrolase family 47-domain-containing protein [Sphaerosporella brunnea]